MLCGAATLVLVSRTVCFPLLTFPKQRSAKEALKKGGPASEASNRDHGKLRESRKALAKLTTGSVLQDFSGGEVSCCKAWNTWAVDWDCGLV